MLKRRGVDNAERVALLVARAFADDLTISTDNVPDAEAALNVIKEFCKWSGTKVNWGKSEITAYDFRAEQPLTECQFNAACAQLKWVNPDDPIRLLGVRSSIKGSCQGEKRHIQTSAKELGQACKQHQYTPEQATRVIAMVQEARFGYSAAMVD